MVEEQFYSTADLFCPKEEVIDLDDELENVNFEDLDLLIKSKDGEEEYNKQLVTWGYMLAYFRLK